MTNKQLNDFPEVLSVSLTDIFHITRGGEDKKIQAQNFLGDSVLIDDSNWNPIGLSLTVANGGTGASDESTARTNLGLEIGVDVQAFDADLLAMASLAKTDGNIIVGNGSTWVAESGATARASLGLGSLATASSVNNSNWSGTPLSIANGGTGATTAEQAKINLGVSDGDYLQADNNLSELASPSAARTNLGLGTLAIASTINNSNWSGTDLAIINGGTGASDAISARTNLGLGSIATQNSSAVSITGGSISGITDLPLADGGTGASTAAAARTNLGVAIGSDVQAYDADLTALGALSKTDGNFIVGNGSTWVAENGATARSSLGLSNVENTSDLNKPISTATQTALNLKANTSSLGALATKSTVNNSDWSGTDLAIVNGGTGASDAATARTNLGVAALDAANVKLTGNQTVAGNKTFTGSNTVPDYNNTARRVGWNQALLSSVTGTLTLAHFNNSSLITGNVTIPATSGNDGDMIHFKNKSGSSKTIAVSSGTLRWMDGGTSGTGTRTLANYGTATAQRNASGDWDIWGVGLT